MMKDKVELTKIATGQKKPT